MSIHLERLLQSQGLGSRRQCRLLIKDGFVEVNGQICDDPNSQFIPSDIHLKIDGIEWIYRENIHLVLHKPAGYECSRIPQHHSSLFTLLPESFLRRTIQPIGRLDQDTTGLLLLTDQGAWAHALTSPKRHVEKGYRIHTKHPVTEELLHQLRQGVMLKDQTEPSYALHCEQTDSHQLHFTISEGQYHQVKRMIAAAGNRVEQLHRFRIGGFHLPEDLAEGEWRDLTQEEILMIIPPITA